jgi:hypothetical protein
MTDDTGRKPNGQFLPGVGGRKPGSRNLLQADFIRTLAEAYQEHGEGALRICAKEDPVQFLKIVASLMPKELALIENKLSGLSDDELDAVLTFVQQRRDAGDRKTVQ